MENNDNVRETLDKLVGPNGVQQLNRSLDMFLKTLEDDDDSEWDNREWKALSVVLDSLFLRISSAGIFLTCLICLLNALP